MRAQLPRGARPDLVVVDTMARNFVGGNENSSLDQGEFVQGCEAIRNELRSAVLVIHHHGKDKENERGGESLRNASHAVLHTTTTKPNQLVCERMKELQKPDPAIMHIDTVPTPELGPDPNDETQVSSSLVVTLVFPPESPAVLKNNVLTKTEQRTSQILEIWKSEGRRLTGAETARRLGVARDDWVFKNAMKKAISGSSEVEAETARKPVGRGRAVPRAGRGSPRRGAPKPPEPPELTQTRGESDDET